ncbi:DUF4190 domain-containing protein [Streptosporangium sp. NPDC006007]|uniref:DUF4190 domain-containing protein n=1 Tax=Streptosporangium sp. NPDC006007 TaxID=3154575 RepID=UPI0033B82475
MHGQQSPGFQQPYGYGQGGYPHYAPPPPPPRTSGLAVASMILGIFWMFGLASLLAVIFGHVAISNIRTTRAKGKGMAITGVTLGYVGLVMMLLFVAIPVFVSGSADNAPAAIATESSNSNSNEDEGAEDETATTPPPTKAVFKAEDYRQVSARGFAKLAKDPDAYIGKHFIVYGEVTQFDAATGSEGFLADTGPIKQQPSYGFVNFGQNAAFAGSKSRLSDVVEDDLFQAYVTVLGSLSYETQIGGNTTVPSFNVDRIKVYGSTKN